MSTQLKLFLFTKMSRPRNLLAYTGGLLPWLMRYVVYIINNSIKLNAKYQKAVLPYHDKRTQVTLAPLCLFQLYDLLNGQLHKRLKV